MATTPVFLPGESQGRGSLVGCRLWGHTEQDTTEVTQQQQQQQVLGSKYQVKSKTVSQTLKAVANYLSQRNKGKFTLKFQKF